MLEFMGYRVVHAEDGQQAIDLYKVALEAGHPPDIIIMDLTIPGGMGGQEAVGEILKINPKAKVIVSSGYSNDPILADYKKYGFRAAVVKPFEMKDLSSVIEQVLL
jgi:CheY-like chemotaxis protein